MSRLRLCLGAVLAVFLAANTWLLQVVRSLVTGEDLFWVRPEPEGVAEVLRQVPAPKLSIEDLETLEAEGVVLVRGLIPNKIVLNRLARDMWAHHAMKFESSHINHKHWLWNGAVRALLRDGPLGALLAQTQQDSRGVRAWESPVWGWRAVPDRCLHMWHADARAETSKDDPGTSVWMVLTDSTDVPLEFLRGSHKHRVAMEEDCARVKPGAKLGFKEFNSTCVEGWYSKLEGELPRNGTVLLSTVLQAGDAYVFSGDVLHRGVRQTVADRLAISVRSSRSGMSIRPEEMLEREICNSLAPVIYPAKSAQRSFDCMPWVLLPTLPRQSPWIPSNYIGRSVIKLVNKVVR